MPSTDTVTIVPQRPDVQLHLAEGSQHGLDLIDRVTKALERAGHHATATAFVSLAEECDTDDDLQLLIRCTVTVL